MAVKKKYVLHPGEVVSKNDGDLHYVSAHHLARLYCVSMEECVVSSTKQWTNKYPEDMLHLYPRYNGDYSLGPLLRLKALRARFGDY